MKFSCVLFYGLAVVLGYVAASEDDTSDLLKRFRETDSAIVGADVQGLPDKPYGDLLLGLGEGEDTILLPKLGGIYKNQLTNLLTDDQKRDLLNKVSSSDLAAVDSRERSQIPVDEIPSVITKLPFSIQAELYSDLSRGKQIEFARTLSNELVGHGLKGVPDDVLIKFIEAFPQTEKDALGKGN